MLAESKPSFSSLSVLPLENSVDSFITLIRRIVLLTIYCSNVFKMKGNFSRRSWKKKESVPWRGPQNGSTSSLIYPFSESLYHISLGFTPIFSTVRVARAHILACGTAASYGYNLSICLHHCTLASGVLPSISPTTLCSYSSTPTWSSSFIRCFSKAHVRSPSYFCYCCLFFYLRPLYYLSHASCRFNPPCHHWVCIFFFRSRGFTPIEGDKRQDGVVRQLLARPVSAFCESA